jgi:hypothetical protein
MNSTIFLTRFSRSIRERSFLAGLFASLHSFDRAGDLSRSAARHVNWQDREYDLVEKIRKQIRAGYGWRNVLKNSPMASAGRLPR